MKDIEIYRGKTSRTTRLLKQASKDGVISCPKCGLHIEPDAPKCSCGWENLLIVEGYI